MIRLFFALLFIFSNLISSEEKKLKVVFPKNFPPSYIYIDNKPSGYAIELFKEIEKDLDLKVEYLPQESWKDVFSLLQRGEVDIIPNQGITEDRKKYVNYSHEIEFLNISLYSLFENKVLGINSLNNKKIGVIKTNIAYKILKNNKNIDLKVFENEEHFFDDFFDGHLEYIVYSEPVILEMAKKRDFLNKIEKNFDLTVIHRAISVRKDKPLLLEKINLSIDKLKANGKLDEIYEKWHKEEETYTKEEIFKILIYLLIVPIILFIYLNYKKIILTRRGLEKEVKRKTALLNENKEKFEFAAETALDGYWEWNLKTNRIICSTNWYKTLKLDKKKFKPSIEAINNLIHKDDQESNELAVRDFISNKNQSYMQELRLKTGEELYLWVQTFGTIYMNQKNEKIFFGFLLNINEKKEFEKQRREQENLILHQSKMAAMGEMLENIAHQWRQPLSMISTSATGISFQKEIGVLKDEYIDEGMKNINDAAQYLSHTIDDFRNYFSSNKQAQNFDISLVLQKVVRILSSKFKNNDIKIEINSKSEIIYNLENEFIQVIINILNNSRDALDNIEGKKYIIINTFKEENYVIIKIKDNAGGIDNSIIKKIFDPYFTTKHKKQGTGLGLYMCNEILTKHMNSIVSVRNIEFKCEDKFCTGAEFTIKLKNL